MLRRRNPELPGEKIFAVVGRGEMSRRRIARDGVLNFFRRRIGVRANRQSRCSSGKNANPEFRYRLVASIDDATRRAIGAIRIVARDARERLEDDASEKNLRRIVDSAKSRV